MAATYWLLITVVCAGIEIATGTLWFLWFAIAALVNLILVYFGVVSSLTVELLIFAAISLTFLIFTRPILMRTLGKNETKSNVDALVGKQAVCTATIEPLQFGLVKLDGVVWTAFSEQVVTEGTVVTVKAVEGVKLKVEAAGL